MAFAVNNSARLSLTGPPGSDPSGLTPASGNELMLDQLLNKHLQLWAHSIELVQERSRSGPERGSARRGTRKADQGLGQFARAPVDAVGGGHGVGTPVVIGAVDRSLGTCHAEMCGSSVNGTRVAWTAAVMPRCGSAYDRPRRRCRGRGRLHGLRGRARCAWRGGCCTRRKGPSGALEPTGRNHRDCAADEDKREQTTQ